MQTRYGLITSPRSPPTIVRAWSRHSGRRVYTSQCNWMDIFYCEISSSMRRYLSYEVHVIQFALVSLVTRLSECESACSGSTVIIG